MSACACPCYVGTNDELRNIKTHNLGILKQDSNTCYKIGLFISNRYTHTFLLIAQNFLINFVKINQIKSKKGFGADI